MIGETPKLTISVMADPINIIMLPEVKLVITRDEMTTYLEQVRKPKKSKTKQENESKAEEIEEDKGE